MRIVLFFVLSMTAACGSSQNDFMGLCTELCHKGGFTGVGGGTNSENGASCNCPNGVGNLTDADCDSLFCEPLGKPNGTVRTTIHTFVDTCNCTK